MASVVSLSIAYPFCDSYRRSWMFAYSDGWGRACYYKAPAWMTHLGVYRRCVCPVYPGPYWFALDVSVLLIGLVLVVRMFWFAAVGSKWPSIARPQD